MKKLCKSKLNEGSLVKGNNTWAVCVIRYSEGIVDWTMDELRSIDRRPGKTLPINGCLYTRINVARLYLLRREGGRGLMGIKECVRRESKSLHGYLIESRQWMLQSALKVRVIVEEGNLQEYKRRKKEEKVRHWKEKALHGEFVQQISYLAG